MRRTYAFAAHLALFGAVASPSTAQDEAVELDPVVVNANRMEPTNATLSSQVDLPAALSGPRAFANSITEKLETYPGYSAFRATSPIAAHPTTQGVRLRNLGANATSRALVVYDGVPQNDPFGGWVYWHQFNLAGLEAINIVPTGGGEVWGNLGSGGIVSLVSASPEPPTGTVALGVGTRDTVDFSASTTQALSDSASVDLRARYFDTDGFYTLDAPQRGPVDEPAFSEATSLLGKVRWQASEDWRLQFVARYFDENRGNGTPLARNETEALNFSVLAERLLDSQGSRLNIVTYHQNWDFQNVFTSVADDRSSERPALEQFDVPSEATGAAVSYKRALSDDDYFLLGGDARVVDGEVNERYRNLGDGFTRRRFAGGEQQFLGAFSTYNKSVTSVDRLSATLRVERIENLDGRRTEIDTENDEVLSDDIYADRSEEEISANLRWRRRLSDSVSSYATIFTGFRAPTLNELYRPYRVRNDIFEANPLLENERQTGIELALEGEYEPGWSFRAALFHYRLEDLVANALVTTESGFDPRFGFIPEGGSASIRSNLDRSRVSGGELQAGFAANEALSFDLNLVYADSEVREDDDFPQFEGNDFPQAASLRANAGAQWQASDQILLWGRVFWWDESYENLRNTIVLPSATRVNVGASYELGPHNSLSLIVDNLFDERTISGISNEGLITVDAPRMSRLLWTWRY